MHIIGYFTEFGGWSWLILGAVLLMLEILMPGIFMLWVGIGAIITGFVTLLLPIGIKTQLIIFMAASLISVLLGRKYVMNEEASDQPLLNQRTDQLIGKVVSVTTPIKAGIGKVKVGDSHWTASGLDADKGSRVRVTGIDGNRLIVEAVE